MNRAQAQNSSNKIGIGMHSKKQIVYAQEEIRAVEINRTEH